MNAKEAKLTEWLSRTGILLESQVVGSGLGNALNSLLARGAVEMTAHPTVKEHGAPAAAVILHHATTSVPSQERPASGQSRR